MKHGFIKVCAATPNIRVADVEFNTEQIIKAIKNSSEMGSMLTVFPELCICGYTCGDLLMQDVLLNAAEKAIEKISEATKGVKTLVFIGAPVRCCGKLYNCAVAVSEGRILGIVPKTFLPNYGEFYELRNFSRPPEKNVEMTFAGQRTVFGTKLIFGSDSIKEFTVAAEICEDLWAPGSPSVRHAQAGANIIVNLSCSDETVGKADYRNNLVKMQSGKLVCGYVYCDAGDGESTTDMVFSGHNIIAENGSILAESKLFENGLIYSDIDVGFIESERRKIASGYFCGTEENYDFIPFNGNYSAAEITRKFPKTPFVPADGVGERAELILSIQAKGLEKRLIHTGAKTAVLGISGGLDSALALLVTVRAFNSLGKDLNDIVAVTMPGFGTTGKTKNNSLKLIESLGVNGRTISITNTVKCHFKDIGHRLDDYDVTYENSQARVRTLVLMDVANKTAGLVVGTGDLSELALGWATYNGDHMSMYGVNCSVPKTLVKHLIKHEADRLGGACGCVLEDILATEISPELLPPENGEITQKTEDLVGPYVLHDFFLYYALRKGYGPDKILYIAEKTFVGMFETSVIEKWLKVFFKRFFSQQFKRSCIPDGVKVGSVSLSPRGDWRMPSDASGKLWVDDI